MGLDAKKNLLSPEMLEIGDVIVDGKTVTFGVVVGIYWAITKPPTVDIMWSTGHVSQPALTEIRPLGRYRIFETIDAQAYSSIEDIINYLLFLNGGGAIDEGEA